MRRPPLTPEEREAIATLRGDQGLSFRKIAKLLGVSQGTVEYRCMADAIERPGTLPLTRPYNGPMIMRRGDFQIRRFTPLEDDWLLTLEGKGLRPCEIARKLGRRPNSVKGRLMCLARRDERAIARAEMTL
jgi:DNA-binding CsgD family transcriptional regulator